MIDPLTFMFGVVAGMALAGLITIFALPKAQKRDAKGRFVSANDR